MAEADIGTSTEPMQPYAGSTGWGVTVIVASICAFLSLGLAGWYFVRAIQFNNESTNLRSDITKLDSDIAAANAWPTKTVEARASELTAEVTRYNALLSVQQVWSKLLPLLSEYTLQGVKISGLSVDGKLLIKLDGFATPQVIFNEPYTAYGMIARQVVAFRDAQMKQDVQTSTTTTPAASATGTSVTKTKSAQTIKLFSDVILTALAEQTKKEVKGDSTVGNFSLSFNLNPDLLKSPAKKATTP